MQNSLKLRQLIEQGETVIAPGVFDGLSAKLVEQAKFKAIYASGGAIARSSGYPDLGLLSFTEVCARLQQIIEVATLPVIADADTGFGNALNVYRTVKEYARLGIAALHLEDQVTPKRCGHLDHKQLVTTKEMEQKIRAALKARDESQNEIMIIARTDAIAVEGFEAAISRALAYLQAGADVIFVEAPQTLEQIEEIARLIPQPKLINMFYGGKTPLVPVEQLKQMGYNIVIIPSDLQRAAIFAMQQTLSSINTDGDSHAISNNLTTFQERENLIGTKDYLDLDKGFNT